ncbi:EAL domain-containing protein [Flaviflagellibacter deserti]|uniref:EAL domain-containing protein n=1 Tax=Flaviflagellibacter deserti TaxID=2267266 RepID=A0ABV9Z0U9_9HYPH
MYRILSCLAFEHDPWLVLVAAFMCVLGSITAMRVFQRAQATGGSERVIWLGTAALAGGCAVWSTHFIAILAYKTPVDIHFDIQRTLLSLIIAIALSGAGFTLAAAGGKWRLALGGSTLGYGVAIMHYVGMSGLVLPGLISWDTALVIASIVSSAIFATAALFASRRMQGDRGLLAAAGLLVLGIVALHFTAMSAVTLTPDPARIVAPSAISDDVLAIGVVMASLMIFSLALLCVIFDRRLGERKVEEARRLKSLADAAVEGLLIVENEIIRDANASFEALLGYSVAEVTGRKLELIRTTGRKTLASLDDNCPTEVDLIAKSGKVVPAEIVVRRIGLQGMTSRVYAIRDLSERRAAEKRIHHMAYHDLLTGLPNRARLAEVLRERLDAAERSGGQLALLALDLDRFKQVNDIFGHHAGDALLRNLASAMSAALRPTEMLARIGGDEFVVVQSGVVQPEGAQDLAERLIAAVCRDVDVDGNTFRAATSIGIAVFPRDGRDVDTLHPNADAALYRAKQDGRGAYRFFEPEMDLRLRERRAMQAEMRDALPRGEFCLHYQPQAETATGVVSGFEALLRWESPKRGSVQPSEFVPLAEENGLIVELGEFVLRTACAEAVTWANPLTVAVNLSPVQFEHGDLPALVRQVLAETGLDPKRLELEITEGVLIHDFARALKVLEEIKALGVCIAMDDFGTGYSSLAYLQAFPFDRIKIDRSFVASLDGNRQSEAIIRAIVGLGRGLNVPITAEGVETEEQHAFLAALDCTDIQGFLIGKPEPIGNFRALVGLKKAAQKVA